MTIAFSHRSNRRFNVRPQSKFGTDLSTGVSTASEAITKAGLNWDVDIAPLYSGEPGSQVLIEGARSVKRTTDGMILGIVGRQYKPIRNVDAFNWFDSIVQSGKASYSAAGQFDKGRSIWVRAKLDKSSEIVTGDVVDQYLLLVNSHDGTGACKVVITPYRGLCSNGLSAAIRKADQSLSVRHTKNADNAFAQANQLLGVVEKQIDHTVEVYKALAKAQTNAAQVNEVLNRLFPDNPEAENHTRTEAKRSLVLDLFEGQGRGLDLPGVKGTAWGLYNAITEGVDHWFSANDEAEQHAERILVGNGANLKGKALKTLEDLVLV